MFPMVASSSPPVAPKPTPAEAVSVQRAARLLDVSVPTVRRLIKAGEIEAVRIGKKLLRIPVDSIRRLRARRF